MFSSFPLGFFSPTVPLGLKLDFNLGFSIQYQKESNGLRVPQFKIEPIGEIPIANGRQCILAIIHRLELVLVLMQPIISLPLLANGPRKFFA